MNLDIITPIYNSIKLSTLLQSINTSKYTQNLNIILVNDGDDRDYSSILEQFNHLKITYLSYKPNQGPGIARQYGLDHSNSPYVTFIDSDDIFLPNGLDTIIETIQQSPDKYLYLFDFIENEVVCSKIDHFGTMGQIYLRDFLNKYNLRFPTEQPYFLEDYGFNSASMYILKYYKLNDKIYHIQKPLAKNTGYSGSLTRKNLNSFLYRDWPRGAAWNTKYAIDLALQNGVSEKFLFFDASKIMSEQYWFYCSTYKMCAGYLNDVLDGCKYYYNNCYKKFQDKFGTDLAVELWNSNYAKKVKDIPNLNFLKFLEILKCNT